MKVIAFGEIVWDVYPDNTCLGGAPLNFAAHLARHGHNVSVLSAVGTDDYGEKALSQIRDRHIHTAHIAQLTDHRTGTCLVSLNAAGVPVYNLQEDVAYDHIPLIPCPAADVLYFGTLALRGKHNRNTLQKLLNTASFGDVFVDVNIRAPFYDDDTIRFAVENATILKISDEELPTAAKALHLSAADPLTAIGHLAAAYPSVRCLILTRGADGAYIYHRAEDTVYTCASKAVKVVSTVGAGDSFAAAFLHQYIRRESIPRCADYAASVAAFVVSQKDAVPPYDPQDINRN